jgi:hypothetical protein
VRKLKVSQRVCCGMIPVSADKRYNLNCHHSVSIQIFQFAIEVRKKRHEKSPALKITHMLDRSLLSAMNRNELITIASYEVAGISVRNIKPFSDMEAVKRCVRGVRYTVFKLPKQETD